MSTTTTTTTTAKNEKNGAATMQNESKITQNGAKQTRKQRWSGVLVLMATGTRRFHYKGLVKSGFIGTAGRESFGGGSAPNKRTFDPGGPVWSLRSNAKDDRTARKQKHLIEAALFGHLDQMLRTTEHSEQANHSIEVAVFGRLNQMLRTNLNLEFSGTLWNV